MSVNAESTARPVAVTARPGLARVRLGSMAVLVLTVVEFGFGMYVNLYDTVPRADQGSGIGSAISNGPATLSIHAVLGLLLGLGALGVLVQAIMSRHVVAIVASAVGLFTLGVASAMGASFTSSGKAVDSMGMSVLTGVALLSYATIIYVLRAPSQRP